MAVAAVVVLSGCAAAGGDSDVRVDPSTSQVIVESQADPWELPLEERPELFDPCAEIPVEAVAEAVGTPLESAENLRNHEPNELISCGWRNSEVLLGVVGTWRTKNAFVTDTGLENIDSQTTVDGRPSVRARDRGDQFRTTCYQVFFTSRGAVVVNVNLIDSLGKFAGQEFSDACVVLNKTIDPILPFLPQGDF